MVLVDTNLLLYAVIPEYAQHPKAYQWLLHELRESPRVGIPWASLMSFVRLAINPRFHQNPVKFHDAVVQIEDWLALDNVWVPEPTNRHLEVFKLVLGNHTQDPNLIPDAHLAALAVEHGLTVYSADQDFAKFQGIKWKNPLF